MDAERSAPGPQLEQCKKECALAGSVHTPNAYELSRRCAELGYLQQLATFERGLRVGLHRFTAEEGLGPDFNTSFCLGCHEKPVPGGGAGRYRNFLLVGQHLSDDSFNETGKNGIQLQYSLDGVHVYQAAIEVPGDTIEENNRAVGTVLVRGRPRVLIADRDRQHAQPLAAALLWADVARRALASGDLGALAEALDGLDGQLGATSDELRALAVLIRGAR